MAADASTALMDFRFALPMLARSTDLDKETVETACALAEMEAECIVEAATALAAKGVPYDYTEDEGFATQCAELVKRAVASAAAEAEAASRGLETQAVRLALCERNAGSSFASFVGYVTHTDGMRYKVHYEPLDPAARPARMSAAWYGEDEAVEDGEEDGEGEGAR